MAGRPRFTVKGHMPTLVRVLARKAFEHDGIAVHAGAWIVLPASEAAILARQGLVNLSKPALQTRVLEPEPDAGARTAPGPSPPLPPRRPDGGDARVRIFGLEITRAKAMPTLQGVDSRGGWYPVDPRVVCRRVAAERRDPPRERDDLRGGLCVRHGARAGHRQAAAAS